MKRTALLLFATILIAGCTKDLNEGNDFYFDDRNVLLKFSYDMDDEAFSKDSLYTNDVGFTFRVTEVNLLLSGFYMTDGPDTVRTENSYALTNLNDRFYKIGKLSAGSYVGNYHFTVGLDSNDNKTSPGEWPSYQPLSNEGLYRGSLKGYNHIIIRGEYFNPNDTSGTGFTPFRYVVGTSNLSREFKQTKYFTVGNNLNVTFDVSVDLAPLFTGINFLAIPTNFCDPDEPVDYALSQMIMNNFVNNSVTLF